MLMASQCSNAYPELEIHLSDSCDINTARNFLLLQVIFCDSFEASRQNDIDYLFEVWYGSQWTDVTRKRFVSDVRLLLSKELSSTSIIPNGANFEARLKTILRSWLHTASSMTVSQTSEIVQQRYYYFLFVMYFTIFMIIILLLTL